MRRPRTFRTLAVAVLLVGGLGLSVTAEGRAPAPVLEALGEAGPVPPVASVRIALTAPSTAPALGGGLVGEVLDGPSGAVLWSVGATTPLLVASTQKLLTAAAALEVLGAGHTARTTLRVSGQVVDGVVTGNLYLQGGGDVLLAATPTSGWPGRATLDQLATDVAAQGIRRIDGSLVADGTAFTGPRTAAGWSPGYVSLGSVAPVTALEVDRGAQAGVESRAPDPPMQAAVELRQALARHHVAVVGRTVEGPTLSATTTVAQVSGPPVEVALQEMLQDSDNDAAESLGRQLAIATHRPATFVGGGAAIAAQLAADGLPTAGTSLADASGLSRADRVTPTLIATLLHDAVVRPAWRSLLAGLPVMHFSGTLADRGSGPAAGVVRAKTGSLRGVTALAGTVVDVSGRQMVFVFVTDQAVGTLASEAALDAVAEALTAL